VAERGPGAQGPRAAEALPQHRARLLGQHCGQRGHGLVAQRTGRALQEIVVTIFVAHGITSRSFSPRRHRRSPRVALASFTYTTRRDAGPKGLAPARAVAPGKPGG
jgi:hypothetical protein